MAYEDKLFPVVNKALESKAAGGHHFNRGGPIDIPLPGRSRYI